MLFQSTFRVLSNGEDFLKNLNMFICIFSNITSYKKKLTTLFRLYGARTVHCIGTQEPAGTGFESRCMWPIFLHRSTYIH